MNILLHLKCFIVSTSLEGLGWNITRFGLEQMIGRMEALGGKTDGDEGEESDAKTDEEKKESDRLEVKTTKTEKVWKLTVEL